MIPYDVYILLLSFYLLCYLRLVSFITCISIVAKAYKTLLNSDVKIIFSWIFTITESVSPKELQNTLQHFHKSNWIRISKTNKQTNVSIERKNFALQTFLLFILLCILHISSCDVFIPIDSRFSFTVVVVVIVVVTLMRICWFLVNVMPRKFS